MVYFAFVWLTLFGFWIYLSWKKLDEKYTDTRPFNEDNSEDTNQEEIKKEVEHKQKIKIE
jgi:hypothetical protein